MNDKRYIGEAGNILDRVAKHGRSLLSNTHECAALQKDWNYIDVEKQINKD